jgi:cytochrome c556
VNTSPARTAGRNDEEPAMKGLMGRAMVVMVGVGVLAACATTSKMAPSEAIAARQQLMKEQGAAMRAIGEKLKANPPQVQAVASDAEKLAETSKKIPALFPEGSLNPATSRAKPEIWQKWSEFEGNAKTLNAKATQFAATARRGDAQATQAAVADIGRNSCTACHDAFRGPEIKK